MTVQTVKTICPHCGFESEDEELCRACGKLTDGDIPVRNVSLAHILGSFFSWLQGSNSRRKAFLSEYSH